MIISFILMICIYDQVVFLYGEIRCLSLLGFKGLITSNQYDYATYAQHLVSVQTMKIIEQDVELLTLSQTTSLHSMLARNIEEYTLLLTKESSLGISPKFLTSS